MSAYGVVYGNAYGNAYDWKIATVTGCVEAIGVYQSSPVFGVHQDGGVTLQAGCC